MPTNEEIIEELKEENTGRVWEFDEPALTKALNKARAEGYKEGYKNALARIDIADIKSLARTILKILEAADYLATNVDKVD